MRILFTFGGMPHYLNALLKRLNEQKGIELYIVLPESKGRIIGEGVRLVQVEDGLNIIKLKEYPSFFGKPYFRGLSKVMRKIRPDIIVTGWPYILPLSLHLGLIFYLKLTHTGLILREIPFGVAPYKEALSYYRKNPWFDEDMNNITPKGIRYFFWAISLKFIRKWYYSIIDASLAYAERAYEIQGSYGLKREQIFVSLNSPDTDILVTEKNKILSEGNNIIYNPYRLIHIGRLVKWKRVDVLLQAASILNKDFPLLEIVIIGTGPEENNLITQSKNLGISGKVVFAGSLYNQDIVKYLLSSGIYVLAGMGGLSINEAMATGKPVICSVGDGTEKTLVREGFNGLYFKEGDAESLAERVRYLFENKDLMQKMGENSESIIRNEVNLDTVTSEFLRCFQYVYTRKYKH